MSAARYALRRTEEGALRVTRSDGSPIDDETVEWFRRVIRSAMRIDAQAKTFASRQREIADDKIAAALSDEKPARYKIDEIILFLEEERIKRGLERSRLAKLMFMPSTRLTDYARGWSRPTMDNLRLWCFMLGWKIMLVPNELHETVAQLVREWTAARDANLPEVE